MLRLKTLRKFILVFVLSLLLVSENDVSAQLANGNYVLSTYDEVYYIHLSNGRYTLFSSKTNDLTADSRQEVESVGSGFYESKGEKYLFSFDSCNSPLKDFAKDSLVCSFTSNSSSTATSISIRLSFFIQNLNNNFLVITTCSGQKLWYAFKDSAISRVIPDSINIKHINLNIMGMDSKELPYNPTFNQLEYTYFVNDKSSNIITLNEVLRIASTKKGRRPKDELYIRPMNEKDISYLKKAAINNSQIAFLVKHWFD
ncbi:hypothetical protein [Sediminibacterium ginsengisoli]|uniref:GLPGLI family protein n=1 Tax=Sediminibacterium ginsengisoli TaxID=413434 RepID=A0A1T4MK41_9BACT|nr:hypothetical protein [Sediminibacterium ginsengisoli]SJZ67399.1 hypothetical protein SAMN04488132_103421 [Sediminibacterium ginsengisoli]